MYNLAHMALLWCADHPEILEKNVTLARRQSQRVLLLRCQDGFRFKLLNLGNNYPFVVPLHASTHLYLVRGKPKPPEGGRWPPASC